MWPPACSTIHCAAAVSHSIDRNVLLGLFAGFLVISGASMLFYQRSTRMLDVSRPVEVGTGTAVGSAAGFLAGLLGVGGGAFVLPVLHGVGVEPHEASAITALVALVSSISGFAARASLGSLDVRFIIVTGVAAALGALVASRFAIKRLSSLALKRIVAVILESVPDYDTRFGRTFSVIEWVITFFFTVEYLLRIWVVDKPSKYIFSF